MSDTWGPFSRPSYAYTANTKPKAPGRTSPKSNLGGSTKQGSGTPRLSNGRYAGGAKVPYTSGLKSPSGLEPFFIGYTTAWFPSWIMLHEHGYYGYKSNQTLPAEKNAYGAMNSTLQYPVLCYCHKYGVCGCDDSEEVSLNNSAHTNLTEFLNSFHLNTSYVLINGTAYSLLNGTLANGTTAPGGTENSGMSLGNGRMGLGYAAVVPVVVATCFLTL